MERVQMTMTNNRLKSIHDKFVSENAKHKKNSKMIWNRLLYYAGDNFLAMNDEEIQQFYRTNIIYEDMEYSTKKNYYYAFRNVVEYIKANGHIVADDCEYNRKTKLVHIPRNKDSKRNDSDSDKLCERIFSLKKSLNLTEQEIKDLEQKLEKLKNKFACDKYRLAKFERVQKEYKKIQKESKRVQEEVKEVLSY